VTEPAALDLQCPGFDEHAEGDGMTELVRIGGPLAGVGLAALMLSRVAWQRLAGFALVVLGSGAIALALHPHTQTVKLAAAAVGGGIVCLLLAAAFHRWPWLLPPAALVCVPLRVPVNLSGSRNLLLPLYAVVASAGLVLAWELVRGDERSRELGPVTWPLAGFVLWSGVSLAWTQDVKEGGVELVFFLLPFSVLALMLARLAWTRRLLQGLGLELVAMALLFAAVGFYQYLTRDVFWNPKVIYSNAYAPFFRVNSVFWDPSVYGRFLIVAILIALTVALLGRSRPLALAATGVIGVLWLGLLLSFSQSSFAALIAGVILAAAVLWRWRALAAVLLIAAVFAGAAFAMPKVRHSLVSRSHSGLNHVTSGRSGLVSNGLAIAVHHPLLGVGLGGFKHAYAVRVGLKGKEPKSTASHTAPVTVAAETGLPGLLLALWLFAATLLALLRRSGRSFEGQVALAVAACLLAIGVHSLFYSDFFEDPTTWGLIALAVAAVGLPEREPAADELRARDQAVEVEAAVPQT
jgi:putative inorganic carbon (HCO3(-)) transporter